MINATRKRQNVIFSQRREYSCTSEAVSVSNHGNPHKARGEYTMLIRIGIFAKCELALKTFLNLKIHLLPYVVRAKKEPVTTLLKTGTEHLPAVLAT